MARHGKARHSSPQLVRPYWCLKLSVTGKSKCRVLRLHTCPGWSWPDLPFLSCLNTLFEARLGAFRTTALCTTRMHVPGFVGQSSDKGHKAKALCPVSWAWLGVLARRVPRGARARGKRENALVDKIRRLICPFVRTYFAWMALFGIPRD
jgi:hypothetical protein